ncbi:MAG TPA: formate dehydrogenase accessory sulfurtransferase FdhD [Candidatus Nanopelagicaceae bacterium]|nr:formate dehydrogenase accessory sulfurtransferase FdhD [Candidatus Nanopelagicaceae bacterium]
MYQRKVNITKIHKGVKKDEIDLVLIESPIDVVVNSEPLVNIICLNKDLKELTVGFLFSIGIINDIEDISIIKIDQLEGKVYVELEKSIDNSKILEMNPVSRVIDTTCGIPSPWRNLIKDKLKEIKNSDHSKESITLDAEIIFSAMIKMQKETPLFKETGGCHGAAIFDLEGNLVVASEDIGRHNAIDKVIGALLLKREPFNNKILTSTGRLTGDSVLKAVRAQIPIVASLSAGIESGIRLAFSYGITLIGFARGKRMNIYTKPNRIRI